MQQLIYFLQKYKYFLYFLLLQFIALVLIINNHNFHKSKFISSTNFITGGLYKKRAELSEYLDLKTQNQILVEENNKLKNLLEKYHYYSDTIVTIKVTDTTNYKQQYQYINGKIINNEFHKPYNFLTLNRGIKQGITSEMAVVNNKGIIGITDNVSNSYARVQSILNRNSKINARFKNSFHFGTLTWNGNDFNTVQLTDIPRQATYTIGDTIITGGKSTIFPEGILIGTVMEVPKNTSALNTINVKLFNDMSNLSTVYIIKNFDKEEIKKLQTPNE
ncbi:rod shape-determining protein MreC [Tenacibaculum sp. IB213877]|uniref:rod shape-determining protein MreC n=1 Tax=Tenacibaculum sp. IB213877 TaxID=3097351 RepID=UPI002A5A2B15|nr:rod shape-determining protein MreC [Tenacibaculum sp. IB213877]MDY0780714.1 rod shape-determining protein MreC [Tenacibaculum sp. IB213877]